jgi:hypothetical protein
MTLQSILNQPIESSSQTTPEWKSMYRKAVNYIKKELADIAENVQVSRGHFDLSGFFTAKTTGQVFYLSVSDVRCYPHVIKNMLIRTAKNYKDYTGGSNMYVRIDDHMKSDIQSIIVDTQ